MDMPVVLEGLVMCRVVLLGVGVCEYVKVIGSSRDGNIRL